MESEKFHDVARALARHAADGADAAAIAETVATVWRQIAASLAPVLGHRGVVALYRRSLQLARPAHAWLPAPEGESTALELELLTAALARRDSADAAAAGGALLQAFSGLLASLIGPALTGRLLRSVHIDSSSAPTAQDSPP